MTSATDKPPDAGQPAEIDETAYLLRSPSNAARLLRSVEQLEAGRGQVRKLLE